MTIGIAGPAQRAPGRSAVVGLIIAAIIVGVGLILLGLVSDFLVEWMWFSSIGYLQVFWTTIVTKAGVFFAVFVTTAVVLWANARLALGRLTMRQNRLPADFDPNLAVHTPPDPFGFIRDRTPWRSAISAGAGLVALLVAWGETDDWSVVLQFLYHVPYGRTDPLFGKDIGF